MSYQDSKREKGDNKPKVVVTGSGGFVGSRLVRMLYEQGYDVISIDLFNNYSTKFRVNHISLDLNSATQDFLIEIMKNSTVVHLAAVSASSDCDRDPNLAIEVNLKLTRKLLEAINECNSRLIFASSEWVYPETLGSSGMSEDIELQLSQQTNLYAMTKIVGEWMVKKYSSDFKILRFGIIYGERATPKSAVESIVNESISSNVVEIGNSQTSRRFIHVDDICLGIIRCIESYCKTSHSVFNLTGDRLCH